VADVPDHVLGRSTQRTERESRTTDDRSDDDAAAGTAFARLGRLAYGGVLAFMAIDGLRNAEERAGYAESKGVPAPLPATVASHAALLFGGVGIALWRLPALAASAAATFFVGVTPMMHDFWTVDDDDQRQQQQIHFLKNSALLGAALFALGVARADD